MPRKRPAPAAPVADSHPLQEQLSQAAHAFAQEILRAIGVATLAAAGAPPHTPAQAQTKTAARAPDPQTTKAAKSNRGNRNTGDWRKEAGTKAVPCPSPGCEQPGVRSKKNFCREHADALSDAEKDRLRLAQRKDHLAQVRATAKAAKQEPKSVRGEGGQRQKTKKTGKTR